MNEHLSVKIGGEYVTLPDDYNIDIELLNPFFNDTESFTYPIELGIDSNRHLLKNVDDIHSDARLKDFSDERVVIIVEGMPLFHGKVKVDSDQEIENKIQFYCISTILDLSDLIGDVNCQDIPVKDEILIGEKIGDIRLVVNTRVQRKIDYSSSGHQHPDTPNIESYEVYKYVLHDYDDIQLQALGFSYPGICVESNQTTHEAKTNDGLPIENRSFINVNSPYPDMPYCNARVCYKHYALDADGTTSKDVSNAGGSDPYFVLPARRAQSGICFYVLYFLDCLFSHLGLVYKNSSLLNVEDLKRLAFFTTHCKYNVKRKYPEKTDFDFESASDINKWLSSRNTRGEISYLPGRRQYDVNGIEFEIKGVKKWVNVGEWIVPGTKLRRVYWHTDIDYHKAYGNILNMYANSLNFPNDSVSSVLDSLWASFGMRFLLDYEKKTIEAVLIRDVFRDDSSPVILVCEIISAIKVESNVTGFRMKYSAESDSKEKAKIQSSGKKDFDSSFDYTDYKNVNASLSYGAIKKKLSVSDTTCYIDRKTGNAYRIKVDGDASSVNELKPSLFEVGTFSGVELGDCRSENEEGIQELVSDFIPVIFNDVAPKSLVEDALPGVQVLSAFVDEDMNHENVEFKLEHALGNEYMDLSLFEIVRTDESYDPSGTDDGNSPLQHYDWGLSVAVMRGGGSNAQMEPYDFNYDGQGNSKWRITSGEYAMTSDCLDNWGNDYDYTGVHPGIGEGERFSLKIRAFKEVYGEILCEDDQRDENGEIVRKVRGRGLFDTFMSEYAHFLLNRKKILVKFHCEISELMDIQWGKRYNIGGYTGWLNKIKCSVSAKSGLGVVEAEMFVL